MCSVSDFLKRAAFHTFLVLVQYYSTGDTKMCSVSDFLKRAAFHACLVLVQEILKTRSVSHGPCTSTVVAQEILRAAFHTVLPLVQYLYRRK